jgi:putative membrane protein
MMVAKILIGLVAVIHLYILVLEMFLWRGRARKVFRMSAEKAEMTAQMAANQGLYNGFLAAGLVWAISTGEPFGYSLKLFFLGCVIVAGLYGAATASKAILFLQALPAAVALAVTLATR